MIALLIIIFVVGYAAIALEHNIRINKTASALITGVLMWTVYIVSQADKHLVNEELLTHLGDISSILFFLMGAMTIVELIDSYNGFEVITEKISQTNKKSLLWIVGMLTFFLSAVLDNLTTTIVMVSLLRKLIKDHDTRLFYVGIVVVAANASITMKGHVERPFLATESYQTLTRRQQTFILILGILMLINVPVFKTLTHLPPFVGMMLGVSIMWIVLEIMHRRHENQSDIDQPLGRTMLEVLGRIDLASILFFLGILLAVATLEASGVLHTMSAFLSEKIGNLSSIVMSIGIISSVVDNVPLVAATMGMYDLAQYPGDSYLWEFLAYCAGTGGSILIIGSAAGVAAMGMEKINFFWYMKKISWLALIGYFAGALFYILEFYFSNGIFFQ
ncbi:Sodium/proton antiporter, NhaD family [uncultured Paludibacter sp.]|uniref:Sodium/proton antiporter, NhaD family n=1 Tax=uncultured Paludibacter sp. TaxID=497635 RepID=A0A653AFR6_9BACT|nr:Sodium/proton antiporter, NhaD family [uncultured Paludibacter sp.]